MNSLFAFMSYAPPETWTFLGSLFVAALTGIVTSSIRASAWKKGMEDRQQRIEEAMNDHKDDFKTVKDQVFEIRLTLARNQLNGGGE